jgi:hypothetical protein
MGVMGALSERAGRVLHVVLSEHNDTELSDGGALSERACWALRDDARVYKLTLIGVEPRDGRADQALPV